MAERREQPESEFNRRLSEAYELQVKGQWEYARSRLITLLSEQDGDTLERAMVQNDRGAVYRMLSDYPSAQACFLVADDIASSFDNKDIQLTALAGLIDIDRTGDTPDFPQNFDRALVYQQKAEKIIKTQEKPTIGTVNAYINFGLLALETEGADRALDYYLKAEEIARKLLELEQENPRLQNRLKRVLTVKGVAQEKLGQQDVSVHTQLEALTGYFKEGDKQGMMNASASIARTYKEAGNSELALHWYFIAKDYSPKPGYKHTEDKLAEEIKALQELTSPQS